MVTVVALVLVPMQPTTIEPGSTVVTPGTAPDVAAAPLAVCTPAATGWAVLTPEKRAMPPLLATELARAQVSLAGSEAAATR